MKTILVMLLLLCFASPAFAEIQPPQWNEFCPSKYLNTEYKEPIKRNQLIKPIAFVGQVCTLNIVPVYWGIIKRDNAIVTNNYWVNRRTQFENELNLCSENDNKSDKINCYMNIRQLEFSKNAQLKNEQIALENQRLQRLQYVQQIHTNSNLNSINNNLNNVNRYMRYGY